MVLRDESFSAITSMDLVYNGCISVEMCEMKEKWGGVVVYRIWVNLVVDSGILHWPFY
jgi:hypothetical protein